MACTGPKLLPVSVMTPPAVVTLDTEVTTGPTKLNFSAPEVPEF